VSSSLWKIGRVTSRCLASRNARPLNHVLFANSPPPALITLTPK
jgi:hypothetical protein